MDISVRYTPGLRRTLRLNFYLRRRYIVTAAIIGALCVIVGLWVEETEPDFRVALFALGAFNIIGPPVMVWLQVYGHREILLKEVELTLTSAGIERRTDTMTVHVAWDMVDRIHERKDSWIFVASKHVLIGVPKRELSQEQQAELAAFIAARTNLASVR